MAPGLCLHQSDITRNRGTSWQSSQLLHCPFSTPGIVPHTGNSRPSPSVTLSSQIDYIVCRQSQATSRAKQAEVLLQFPVACWREGATHHPVMAHIAVPTQARSAPPAVTRPAIHLQQIIDDVRSAAVPEALRTLREQVQQGLSEDRWANMHQLEQDIISMAVELYPKTKPNTQAQGEAIEELHNKARTMWGIFRSMRAQPFTAQGIFRAWQLWARFSQAHREHKARAKGAKLGSAISSPPRNRRHNEATCIKYGKWSRP